jgi:hypothetical protein
MADLARWREGVKGAVQQRCARGQHLPALAACRPAVRCRQQTSQHISALQTARTGIEGRSAGLRRLELAQSTPAASVLGIVSHSPGTRRSEWLSCSVLDGFLGSVWALTFVRTPSRGAWLPHRSINCSRRYCSCWPSVADSGISRCIYFVMRVASIFTLTLARTTHFLLATLSRTKGRAGQFLVRTGKNKS